MPLAPSPRGRDAQDREILVESEAVIKELRSRVKEHISSSQGITDGLRKILTPQQIAKFLMWVEKNQRSMDMLNSFDWELQLDSAGAGGAKGGAGSSSAGTSLVASAKER